MLSDMRIFIFRWKFYVMFHYEKKTIVNEADGGVDNEDTLPKLE